MNRPHSNSLLTLLPPCQQIEATKSWLNKLNQLRNRPFDCFCNVSCGGKTKQRLTWGAGRSCWRIRQLAPVKKHKKKHNNPPRGPQLRFIAFSHMLSMRAWLLEQRIWWKKMREIQMWNKTKKTPPHGVFKWEKRYGLSKCTGLSKVIGNYAFLDSIYVTLQ